MTESGDIGEPAQVVDISSAQDTEDDSESEDNSSISRSNSIN